MAANLVPAAPYLRMSTEHQQYSLDNQFATIRMYAEAKGFEIVQTYSDGAKSGVALKRRVGLRQLLQDVVSGNVPYRATRPEQILAAKHSALAAIGKAGILPDVSAEKLLVIAKIAYEEFDGDLRSVLKKPLPQAKKGLKRFPSIGDPGAEKILLR